MIDQSFAGDMTSDGGVSVARLKGRTGSPARDQADVDAFCERVRGTTYRDYRHTFRHHDHTPIPAGCRNLRVYDGRDGKLLGTRWFVGEGEMRHRAGVGFSVSTRRPTAQCVLAIAHSMALEEITEWRGTRALPEAESGVLDLVIDIDTRPRQFVVDGERLPQDLIDFIASRAPGRVKASGARPPR